MIFNAEPELVWVSVVGKDLERHVVKKNHCDFIDKFYRWMQDVDIRAFKTISSGAGQWHGLFYTEDWPKVAAWLKENGAESEEQT